MFNENLNYDPSTLCRVKAVFNKGLGEGQAIYFFRDFQEFDEMTKNNPDVRADLYYLPEHRAYINQFLSNPNTVPGSFLVFNAGADTPCDYSAKFYMAEMVETGNNQTQLCIGPYLIKINIKPNSNFITVMIVKLDTNDNEQFLNFRTTISLEDYSNIVQKYANSSDDVTRDIMDYITKKYVIAFCRMQNTHNVLSEYFVDKNPAVTEMTEKEFETLCDEHDSCNCEDHA